MKIKFITTVSTTEHPGFHRLEASLQKFGYDYKVFVDPGLQWAWGGMHLIYEWCKEDHGYTHFLYTDGFDTIALGPPEEVYERYTAHDAILYSGEKGCFPRADWAPLFPASTSRWVYLNHGQFMAPVDVFMKEYETCIGAKINCQEWASAKYLFDNANETFRIDTNCDIFQSIAFRSEDDFSVEGRRLVNNITKTQAPWAHSNGGAHELPLLHAIYDGKFVALDYVVEQLKIRYGADVKRASDPMFGLLVELDQFDKGVNVPKIIEELQKEAEGLHG